MKVAITGSSGLIGSALCERLRADGHEVLRLVRRPATAADEAFWDPGAGRLDPATLAGVDAVVNLAGAGIGDRRWNSDYRRTLRASRLSATHTLCRAMVEAGTAVLVSGSAVGYYGDTGVREVDESAPAGADFLAELCVDWEQATAPAADAGTRVATVRTGLVLARHGGMMDRVRPLFRLGLGGRLGSGRQYWPWISLADEVSAIVFLLTHPVTGPVNLTGPVPVTNAEFTHTLGGLLHRPTLFPVPPIALRTVLGEFADVGVLAGQRAVPRVLEQEGFDFTHPTLERALQWALEG